MRPGSRRPGLLGPLARPEAAPPPSLPPSPPASIRAPLLSHLARSGGASHSIPQDRSGAACGPSWEAQGLHPAFTPDRRHQRAREARKAAPQRGAEPGMAEGRSGVDCLASRHRQRIEPSPPLICGLRTWVHSRRRGRRPRPSAALPVGGPGRASGCGLRAQPHPPEDHRRGRIFALNKINGLKLRRYHSFDSGRYHSFDSPAYHYRQLCYLW